MTATGVYYASPTTLGDGEKREALLDSGGRMVVSGSIAAGSTDSGSPVKVGGTVVTASLPGYTPGQRGNLSLGTSGAAHITLGASYAVDSVASGGTYQYAPDTSGNLIRPLAVGVMLLNGSGTGDRIRGDVNGVVVQPALSTAFWSYAAATGGIVNTTTAVTIKAAAGASVRNYLNTLTLSHDTLGAATEIAIRDGAGGTVLWRGKLQTTATDSASGSGTITFDPPLRGTANTLMEVVTLTAVTGGVFVNASGYTGV